MEAEKTGRLRRAVADLTLDNQILKEAARGKTSEPGSPAEMRGSWHGKRYGHL